MTDELKEWSTAERAAGQRAAEAWTKFFEAQRPEVAERAEEIAETARVTEVQDKHEASLMAMENVVGVAASLKITKGKPHRHDAHARNANGSIDIRARPMWREWEATLQVQYDADQFTLTDVANLINRVGLQVGIGEGRHDSKESAGLGWGTFTILEDGKKRN